MQRLLTLHVGGIDNGRERLHTAFRGKRAELLYELNNWLFDFFYVHKIPIAQLPPLDDWTNSSEDSSYWSIAFFDKAFNVWIRSELVEFKV